MKKLLLLILISGLCVSFVACSNTKHGEKDIDEKYNDVIVELNSSYIARCINNSYDFYDGSGEAKKIYDKFLSLDNYKDSLEYLSNFIICHDALVKISRTETDAFGQTRECTNDYSHRYSNYGECVDFLPFFQLIGLKFGYERPFVSMVYDYNYDKDQKINAITIREKITNLILCQIDLEYDIQDNLIKVTYLTVDNDTYTNTYIYDEQNLLLYADVTQIDACLIQDGKTGRNRTKTHYVYDENNELCETIEYKYYSEHDNPDPIFKQYTYKYRTDGILIQKEEFYSDANWKREEYVYDESGKIISSKVTHNTGETYTLTYHYETLYFYWIDN